MKVEFFLSKLLGPVILILLGLILLISPDSASALVANILGWALVVAAIGCGIAALVSPAKRFGKVASAIIFAAAGGWLRAHPLMLAATIGRFCGLFLWISSIQNIRLNKKLGRRGILPWVNAVAGLALIIFIPLSISRMVFSLCGLVVLIAGIVILLDNLKSQNRLDEPQDPNIIDAL